MEKKATKVRIAVVDDHGLFRNGLIQLINFLNADYQVVISVSNGQELMDELVNKPNIDLVLLDVEMPVMNGFETAERLRNDFPEIKVVAVTMNEEETSFIKMLKLGVRGFLNKDIDPNDLRRALDSVIEKGYHYTDRMTGRLITLLQNESTETPPKLTENESTFLKLACSEDTYKVIADKMCLAPKTIDGYRANLFEKLNVKSRVGLVMYAIKHKMVEI